MDYNVFNTLGESTNSLWGAVTMYVPSVLLALLVLIIGWIVAGMLKGAVMKFFKVFKLNEALDAAGLDTLTERAGHKLNAGYFMGTLVKWFVIAVFFVAALDILGLNQVTFFIRDVVLGYLPKVIVAVLILMVAMIVAKAASGAVAAAIRAGGTHQPVFFEKLTYYSIVTFAVLAALNQLEIAPELVQTLFMGVVFALALALGLSFGLGGKDAAARYIDDLTKHNRQ
jgi:small-conductance mechanosensitive channel